MVRHTQAVPVPLQSTWTLAFKTTSSHVALNFVSICHHIFPPEFPRCYTDDGLLLGDASPTIFYPIASPAQLSTLLNTVASLIPLTVTNPYHCSLM